MVYKVVRVDHGAESPRIKLCWVPTPKEENTRTPPMCSRVLEISPFAQKKPAPGTLTVLWPQPADGRIRRPSAAMSGKKRLPFAGYSGLRVSSQARCSPKSLSRYHVVSSIYVVKFTFLNWILSLVLPICPTATDFCESEVCSCLQILPVSILCVYYYFYKKQVLFFVPLARKKLP